MFKLALNLYKITRGYNIGYYLDCLKIYCNISSRFYTTLDNYFLENGVTLVGNSVKFKENEIVDCSNNSTL